LSEAPKKTILVIKKHWLHVTTWADFWQ